MKENPQFIDIKDGFILAINEGGLYVGEKQEGGFIKAIRQIDSNELERVAFPKAAPDRLALYKEMKEGVHGVSATDKTANVLITMSLASFKLFMGDNV
jgi:hypothetical protein